MKKEYKKPVAELVRFELNDAIASCANNIYKNNDTKEKCFDTTFEGLTFEPNHGCDPLDPKFNYCYYTAKGINIFDS